MRWMLSSRSVMINPCPLDRGATEPALDNSEAAADETSPASRCFSLKTTVTIWPGRKSPVVSEPRTTFNGIFCMFSSVVSCR